MPVNPLSLQFMLQSPVHFLALGFGSGLSPKAPGTMGSIAAIPLLFLLPLMSPFVSLVFIVLVCLIGIYLCGKTAENAGVHDHPGIVWDEIAGMLICFYQVKLSLVSILVGFALFRLFDIAKPWPISLADQNISGGLGIMLDDILAGVFAAIIMQLIF